MGLKRSTGIYKVQPISIKELPLNTASNGVNKTNLVEDERKTEWRSIYLCALFTFTASVQFTLFFTSLWPFMQIVLVLFK